MSGFLVVKKQVKKDEISDQKKKSEKFAGKMGTKKGIKKSEESGAKKISVKTAKTKK